VRYNMKKSKEKKASHDVIDDDDFEDKIDEEMDMDVVKAIIDEFVSDEVVEAGEDEETKIKKAEKTVILEANTIEEGLKKASELLEVHVKEVKYIVLDEIVKDSRGNILQPYRLEFNKKSLEGDIVIQISSDKLKAYIHIIYPKFPNGKEVDYDDVINAIHKKKISYGIKEDEIGKVINELKNDYEPKQNILIAEGVPPVKGGDGTEIVSIFKTVLTNETVVEEDVSFMYHTNIESIKEEYHAAIVANENELLAEITRGEKGKEGKNVFGESVPAEKGKEKYTLGDKVYIDIEDKKVCFKSKIYGYVQLKGNEISVVSPLWVSENLMEAYFINLPQKNPMKKIPYKDAIENLIKLDSIEFGVKERIIDKIINKVKSWKEFEVALLLAEGTKPEPGKDALIEFFFNTERKPGKILSDGSIDFKEQELIPVVKENQLLAAKYPPQEGIPGKNLKGDEAQAESGKDRNIKAQNNVRVVQGKGKVMYYSMIEGKVQLISDSSISVNKHYNVKGNVDYSTGNVYFNGDVNIKGSVLSGFKVKSGGSVTIKGTVNPGAEIVAGGDVIVGEGILGKGDTNVVAGGIVKAKFLQNVNIEAESDVIIGSYILNSSVKCGGMVITPPKDFMKDVKGSIAGGSVNAVLGIKARNIGSDYTKGTKIIVGSDWKFEKKLNKIISAFEYLELSKKKLLRTIRIADLDPAKIKEVFKKLPKQKQMDYLKVIEKIKEFEKMEKEIENKKRDIMKETQDRVKNANISILENLYPNVFIQIGETKMMMELSLQRVRLFEDKNKKEIIWKKM